MFATFSGSSSTRVPAGWNSMPSSTEMFAASLREEAHRELISVEGSSASRQARVQEELRARHGEEHSAGLWKIEMANARAQAATEQEAAVARCRSSAAAALDNARAHAGNHCERLEEGFVRERDRAAVADLVLADMGAQLREEQAMVSEFQDTALGMQAQVDEFVEQYAESTKRVIDRECSDMKKHVQDLVENAEALAWHEESVVTELRRELQQARSQVSQGSGLAEQQQGQLESAPMEPLPECLGTLRMKAASDPFRVSSLAFGSSMPPFDSETRNDEIAVDVPLPEEPTEMSGECGQGWITEEAFFTVSPGARQVRQRKEVKMNQLSPAEKGDFLKSMEVEWLLKNQAARYYPWKKRPKLERAGRIVRWTLVGHVLGSQTKASHRGAVRRHDSPLSLTSSHILRHLPVKVFMTVLQSVCSHGHKLRRLTLVTRSTENNHSSSECRPIKSQVSVVTLG